MSYLKTLGATEVDPKLFGVDADFLQMLYNIGILGVNRTYFPQSGMIFEALRSVRPQAEQPLIGLGLLSLAKKDYETAISFLVGGALEVNPESGLAKAVLGLAFREIGQEDLAKKAFNEVIEQNQDEKAVALAKQALESKV